jgi:hypothetical protein
MMRASDLRAFKKVWFVVCLSCFCYYPETVIIQVSKLCWIHGWKSSERRVAIHHFKRRYSFPSSLYFILLIPLVHRSVTSAHVSAYIELILREDNQRGSTEALKLVRLQYFRCMVVQFFITWFLVERPYGGSYLNCVRKYQLIHTQNALSYIVGNTDSSSFDVCFSVASKFIAWWILSAL